MNRALQWKLIAGFILVFIAGGMTGGLIAVVHARRAFFEWHDPALAGQRMRDRLRVELKLTPEQVQKISPIVDKAATQLGEIRKDTGRRVHETMMEAHREIATNLTEVQRVKLKEMEARHRHWHGMHGPQGAPGEPSP